MKGEDRVDREFWARKLLEGYSRQKDLYEALLAISVLERLM